MEDHIRLKGQSRSGQSLGEPRKDRLTQESPNQRDKYNSENSNFSYASLHHDIARNLKETSPYHLANEQKQPRKPVIEEELVRYMSKLPSYLERGETRHEKVLNVGVLDWSHLEKWQGIQKQMQQRSSRPSLSSANSPVTFTTEGSSVHSSRSTSSSPARQRIGRRSLQFHLTSSFAEGSSRNGQSFEENFEKIHGGWTNTVTESKMVDGTDQTAYENDQETKLYQPTRKGTNAKTNQQSEIIPNGLECAAMNMRLKKKNQGKLTQSEGKFPEQNASVPNLDAFGNEIEVHAVPKDVPASNYSKTQLSTRTAMVNKNLKELGAASLLEKPASFSCSAVSSDVPRFCPMPSEMVKCSGFTYRSQDVESIAILPEPSQSASCLHTFRVSPPHGRISDSKKANLTMTQSVYKEPSMGSKVSTEKCRSTSPFCRLSFGMSKISKGFSSREGSSMPQSNAAHPSGRSDVENAMASFSQNKSTSDAQNSKSRAKSSPLRRLLDPLLKPKPTSQSGEALPRDSVMLKSACKSPNRPSNPGTSQPRIEKSAFQALLQVAVKNGQPLFTFAVDNEPDILAATMKNLTTSSEDDYSCIYTLFAIQEIKKKNGRWMNQGNKGKGHDYIPNVVAQVKGSGSQITSLNQKGYTERLFAREFVLLDVDLQQSDPQTLDFQPNNELAAIVVKIPKVIKRSRIKDEHQTIKCGDAADLISDSNLRENAQCPMSATDEGLVRTIVILPSGIHSLPSKGGPSSLMQRWRTGGSCDCGGWDPGCKLRILSNHKQDGTTLSSQAACSATYKFELFSQGREEKHTVFSLSPFQDGIYSVEFDSILSILQAFSICIAVLEGKKLCEDPEINSLQDGNTSLDGMLTPKYEIRVPSRTEGNIPAKYASYPPLSPVGRV